MTRQCPCGTPLHRKQRMFCSNACRLKALRALATKLDADKREQPCSHCGALVLRGLRRKTISCDNCKKARHVGERQRYRDHVREEARRYRVLMAVGPYRTWNELLEAIRIRGTAGKQLRKLQGKVA